jgi:hypothetical protein
MIKVPVFVALLSLGAGPAWAQSPVYGGGTVAVDAGSRGAFDTLGTFPAVGGFIGWRFHEAWSIELDVDRGFGESAEREQLEIFGRSIRQDRASVGYSVLATWKVRRRSRVGAAVTMGMSTRAFRTDRLSITKTIPDDPYPVSLGTAHEDAGAGWAGGILVPIAIGGRWSLAPEIRVTLGLTGESFYAQFLPGVRVIWGF